MEFVVHKGNGVLLQCKHVCRYTRSCWGCASGNCDWALHYSSIDYLSHTKSKDFIIRWLFLFLLTVHLRNSLISVWSKYLVNVFMLVQLLKEMKVLPETQAKQSATYFNQNIKLTRKKLTVYSTSQKLLYATIWGLTSSTF